MSDLATYKATFKTNNKYLKYFCDKPALDWTFNLYRNHFSDHDAEKIKRVYRKNLQTVKEDSKNVSAIVHRHIDQLLEPFNSSSSTPSSSVVNNITVKGNYYNAGRDVTINETTKRDSKKQKINHEDMNETEEVEFKQKWVEFLADAEQSKNFHKYSPEKNGVTRLGAKLSPHPNADKDTYRHLKKQLKPCEATGIWIEAKNYISDIVTATTIDEFEKKIEAKVLLTDKKETCQYINAICKIMAKVYRKRPSISRSESVYNVNMIYPCLEAMLVMMKGNEHGPYFIPGEDELAAMTIQLRKMGCKVDKRRIYKADGIIRLSELEDLEVLVLETAGAFSIDDHGKTAFDNSKGMFALLAMLKTIADHYKHASVGEFKKLKLYFIQPSDKYIRLWSMQYAKHGLYNFIREKKILLGEDFEKRDEHLINLINFFLSLKDLLNETMKTIAVLKSQHEENERFYDSENSSQVVLLSDIICPRIFKLSFNTHGQNFAKEHLKSSPESDC